MIPVRVDVDDLLQESMQLLRDNQRLLREAMLARDDDGKFNERHSAQAQRLARSVAALGAEVRKHGDEIEDAAKKATPERRAEAAERWLVKLPKDLLRPIVERLVRSLKER